MKVDDSICNSFVFLQLCEVSDGKNSKLADIVQNSALLD